MAAIFSRGDELKAILYDTIVYPTVSRDWFIDP